jgi:hypothetical protein
MRRLTRQQIFAPWRRKAESQPNPSPRVSPPPPAWLTVPSVVARVCAWVPLQLRQRRLPPTRAVRRASGCTVTRPGSGIERRWRSCLEALAES